MIKVLIVDDHELLRTGIRKLLTDVKDLDIVGEANSGEEAIKMVQKFSPNVVLLDVKMPGIGGLEACRRLLRQNPDIKILALTSCNEEPFPSRFLQAGAKGYLTKGCGLDEMILAIRKVNNNERYISPEIAQLLAVKNLDEDKKGPLEKLSDREMQVLIMISSGNKVQEISDKLCLSPKTINSYRYRLFEKLKLTNDVELTHLAIRYGIITSDLDNINDDDLPSDNS